MDRSRGAVNGRGWLCQVYQCLNLGLGLDTARLLRRCLVGFLVLAGLAATTHVPQEYVFGAGFAALLVWGAIRERARVNEIRALAQRLGFTYLGAAFPGTFPLYRTSSRSARSIVRAALGDRNEKEVILFDCRMGHGKGSFSRTVVAVRGQSVPIRAHWFGPDLLTEQAGDWTVVFRTRGLMLVEEIEALLDAL